MSLHQGGVFDKIQPEKQVYESTPASLVGFCLRRRKSPIMNLEIIFVTISDTKIISKYHIRVEITLLRRAILTGGHERLPGCGC
jgi:hypothetical protein